MLYISDKAQKYLVNLLDHQEKGTQIRIFLKNLNTLHPECGICYYLPEHNKSDDIAIKFNFFSIYLNQNIASFIKNTHIDLVSNALGTHLSINSPNLHALKNSTFQNINKKSSLEDQIKHILDSQVNPKLSMHGGSVSLVRITKDFLVILKFYGGCNGCTMASYTIKEGIEKILKKLFPKLKGVADITQHKHGTHSYY